LSKPKQDIITPAVLVGIMPILQTKVVGLGYFIPIRTPKGFVILLTPWEGDDATFSMDSRKEIIDIILQRDIMLVPVVDDKHKLIGLVGRPDILQQNLNQKFVTIIEKRK
jgi:hypothetical protein